jgi:hypothetical protein
MRWPCSDTTAPLLIERVMAALDENLIAAVLRQLSYVLTWPYG